MNNDFKIPQKYLIDFDTLKVGDRVWSLRHGYTTVSRIDNDEYPISINGISYAKSGKDFIDDQYPSLFRSNPFEGIREEFFKDTLMEVREEGENDEYWVKRVVFGKKNGKWIAWQNGETLESAKTQIKTKAWVEARHLPPPSEELVHLTLKDISEGKGKGVPAHLIRIKE